jgi:hypothetical protein
MVLDDSVADDLTQGRADGSSVDGRRSDGQPTAGPALLTGGMTGKRPVKCA